MRCIGCNRAGTLRVYPPELVSVGNIQTTRQRAVCEKCGEDRVYEWERHRINIYEEISGMDSEGKKQCPGYGARVGVCVNTISDPLDLCDKCDVNKRKGGRTDKGAAAPKSDVRRVSLDQSVLENLAQRESEIVKRDNELLNWMESMERRETELKAAEAHVQVMQKRWQDACDGLGDGVQKYLRRESEQDAIQLELDRREAAANEREALLLAREAALENHDCSLHVDVSQMRATVALNDIYVKAFDLLLGDVPLRIAWPFITELRLHIDDLRVVTEAFSDYARRHPL